jgi:hypothetical protein
MHAAIGGLVCVALVTSGCPGVTFRSETVNDLPSDFKTRTSVSNTASYRFHLEQQIGAIIGPDPVRPGQYVFVGKTILPPGFRPTEEQLDRNSSQVYSSKVTYGGSATAGISQLFGLTIDADNSKELTIVDVARSEVPTNIIQGAVPALLKEKAAKGAAKEYWIKSLLLSQILIKAYSKEESDAKGSGPAYGATVSGEAKVYATNDLLTQDFFLGADLIDLDDVTADARLKPLSRISPVLLGRIAVNKSK